MFTKKQKNSTLSPEKKCKTPVQQTLIQQAPANSDLARQLRESRSTLAVSGIGVLYFSAWGFIKALLELIYRPDLRDTLDEVLALDGIGRLVVILFLLLLMGFVTSIYAYVGFCAIAESRGKKKGVLYLVLTVLLFLSSCASIVGGLYSWWINKSAFSNLVTVIVEITFLVAVIDLLTSVIRIRRLQKIIEG